MGRVGVGVSHNRAGGVKEVLYHREEVTIEDKIGPGTVAHACNYSTLGGQGGQIT